MAGLALLHTVGSLVCLLTWLGVQSSSDQVTTFLTDGYRLVELVQEDGPSVAQCFVFADRTFVLTFLEHIPNEKTVSPEFLDSFIQNCSLQDGDVFLSDDPKRYRRFAIFPGTKWCGAGTIAQHNDDLGHHTETDMCCREHDHCNYTIASGETKYNLENHSFFTRSHCSCDRKFYKCLHSSQETASAIVGVLFFNILDIKCFQKEYPKVCTLRL